MDEPVRGRLRATCHRRRLTSPGPVTVPHGPSGPPPAPLQRNPDKPQNRKAAGKSCPENHQDHSSAGRPAKTSPELTRWIETKPSSPTCRSCRGDASDPDYQEKEELSEVEA
jgi:hypothetical protein